MLYLYDDVPLAPAYAARLAAQMGYAQREGSTRLFWFPPRTIQDLKRRKKEPYAPHIEATSNDFAVCTSKSHVRLTLSSLPIHCRMMGEAWDEAFLFGLRDWLRDLPYSAQVMTAIIEQADFLDEHPEYRGLPGIAARRDQSYSVTEY